MFSEACIAFCIDFDTISDMWWDHVKSHYDAKVFLPATLGDG